MCIFFLHLGLYRVPATFSLSTRSGVRQSLPVRVCFLFISCLFCTLICIGIKRIFLVFYDQMVANNNFNATPPSPTLCRHLGTLYLFIGKFQTLQDIYSYLQCLVSTRLASYHLSNETCYKPKINNSAFKHSFINR